MPSFTAEQATAFRLDRHHLSRRSKASLETVCGDVCGIQAQVTAAAELALGIRTTGCTRDDVRNALWRERTLIKTSAMRSTLHLVPAREFNLYISALKQSRTAWLLALLNRRLKITEAEIAETNQLIMEALSRGPRTQLELAEMARRKASKRLRVWLDRAWSGMRLRAALIEGLVCYGPPRGTEATLVRVDQWLPEQPKIEETIAQQELLRRYLSAYGPATVRDFAKWSGMTAAEAKAVWESVADEMQQLTVDGTWACILCRDLDALANSKLDCQNVRLLPSFDPLLLAHATKDHLVGLQYYKRVYLTLGRIAPVVLVGGKIAGTWGSQRDGKTAELTVHSFAPLARAIRTRIEEEAEEMSRFLGTSCSVRFAI